MNRQRRSLLRAALVLVLAGCNRDAGMQLDAGSDAAYVYVMDFALPSCPTPTAFAAIRSSILPSCAGYGCHHDAPFAGGLDLTDGGAYSSLVSVQATKVPSLLRVKPGAPSESFLWRKLNNQLAENGSQGQPMPLGAENLWFALPADQRAQIYCWIQAGAPNN